MTRSSWRPTNPFEYRVRCNARNHSVSVRYAFNHSARSVMGLRNSGLEDLQGKPGSQGTSLNCTRPFSSCTRLLMGWNRRLSSPVSLNLDSNKACLPRPESIQITSSEISRSFKLSAKEKLTAARSDDVYGPIGDACCTLFERLNHAAK